MEMKLRVVKITQLVIIMKAQRMIITHVYIQLMHEDTCSGQTDGTGIVVDNDTDDDGVCNSDEVAGCQDAVACNYNESATDDDESCIFNSDPCYGCSGELDGTGTIVDNYLIISDIWLNPAQQNPSSIICFNDNRILSFITPPSGANFDYISMGNGSF